MASWSDRDPCLICGRHEIDKAGNVKHEPWCAHFLRGPDAGGDPHEWPTLLEALETEET